MKFPRTPHLPGSRGTDDDIYTEYDYVGEVIATEKMDGSNIMMNNKKFITRKGSTSTADWTYPVRNLHYTVQHLIPEGHWLAGEFLYWKKTVGYENLPGIFLVFGVIKGNECLAWDDVCEIAEACGLPTVPVIARGDNADKVIKEAKDTWREGMEGFVVRPADSFQLPHYDKHVAKWVNDGYTPTATNTGVNGVQS